MIDMTLADLTQKKTDGSFHTVSREGKLYVVDGVKRFYSMLGVIMYLAKEA